ncbi:MAG: DNA topoisomerase 3 [Defluviitaleaceae bacterium]|nr:DNA topoisomerase 3 [Defluviitaleaceae bacterium]
MKTLVLAEKPSVGKDIARVLGCRSGGGFMEGSQYIVTWALGHLVTLADPEGYDKAYKSWDINHLPIMPEKLKLVVIPQTSKQFKIVKDLLLRKDVGGIVVATDAGREGELVARWIIEMSKCTKPIKRLWISSVTDKAIREGFANLKDGKQYQALCDSAKARAEADWLVGINATRCLTTKYNSSLSCGRVQTPTVAIIAKREEEIRKFQPTPFYGLSADMGGFKMNWIDKNGSTRCFDKQKAENLLSQLQNKKDGVVAEIEKTIKRKMPPKLYDLTELQRDASKKFGYSPKETLSIMQKLYEEHKVLTYPRTDSRFISDDIVPTLPERLKACSVQPYQKIAGQILRAGIKPNKNFVDNSKVSDHHAIIPTESYVNFSNFNDKERKIYNLVITRFLSVFLPPFEYEQVVVKIKIDTEMFRAGGRRVISEGYQAVFSGADDDDEDETAEEKSTQRLPEMRRGEKIPVKSIKLTEGKTTPPPPFNEATLLSAMENPAKYMDSKDKALADTLSKTGGLGTVATRADIIEKLFDNFLIEKKGKEIFTTSKARQLLTIVPKDLKSPELTGSWEQKLSVIASGKMNKNEFLKEIRTYTREIIIEIKNSTQAFKHDNLSTTKCTECGLFMLQVTGKKGEMLVCQDRECNTRVSLSQEIRSQCPNCRKFVKIVGTGEKRQVICSCGHKEKYENFEKRKKEEKNAMSNREVQAYLDNAKKKEKTDPKNSPFAALSGIKFDKK